MALMSNPFAYSNFELAAKKFFCLCSKSAFACLGIVLVFTSNTASFNAPRIATGRADLCTFSSLLVNLTTAFVFMFSFKLLIINILYLINCLYLCSAVRNVSFLDNPAPIRDALELLFAGLPSRFGVGNLNHENNFTFNPCIIN